MGLKSTSGLVIEGILRSRYKRTSFLFAPAEARLVSNKAEGLGEE